MIVGIGSGLAAAFCQSLSFLGTRHFAHGRGKWAGRQLLVVGHMWMGIFSAVVLATLWPAGQGWHWVWAVGEPLLQFVGFFVVGQICMTLALHHAEPSRVSPLLGVKIVAMAALSAVLPQGTLAHAAPAPGLTWMQWTGVVLATVAAVGLSVSGVKLRRRVLLAIGVACVTFTLADWNIQRTNIALAAALPGVSAMRLSFLNVGLGFGIMGVIGAALAPAWGARKARVWVDALPFASMWFGGMLLLYWSFAEVGPLLGVILQSTRGLMSIVIGSLLMYWGHHHLEPVHARGVLVRRLAAGILMFLAVGLYVLKEPGNIRMGLWHSSWEAPPWKAQPTLPPASAGTNC